MHADVNMPSRSLRKWLLTTQMPVHAQIHGIMLSVGNYMRYAWRFSNAAALFTACDQIRAARGVDRNDQMAIKTGQNRIGQEGECVLRLPASQGSPTASCRDPLGHGLHLLKLQRLSRCASLYLLHVHFWRGLLSAPCSPEDTPLILLFFSPAG
jgi:hypothetical protein